MTETENAITKITEERKIIENKLHEKKQKRSDFINKHLTDINRLIPDAFYRDSDFLEWIVEKDKDFFYDKIQKKKKVKFIPNKYYRMCKKLWLLHISSDKKQDFSYLHIQLSKDPFSIKTVECSSEIWNLIKEILPIIKRNFLSYYIIKEGNNTLEIKKTLEIYKNDDLICIFCGEINQNKAIYCNYCGEKIKNNKKSDKND